MSDEWRRGEETLPETLHLRRYNVASERACKKATQTRVTRKAVEGARGGGGGERDVKQGKACDEVEGELLWCICFAYSQANKELISEKLQRRTKRALTGDGFLSVERSEGEKKRGLCQ